MLDRLLSWLGIAYLLVSLVALSFALWQLLKAWCRRQRTERPDRTGEPATEGHLPEHVVRIADPLLYSQEWLLQHGLSVTWQNPDFRIETAAAPGTPVSSWQLAPGTDYRVLVNVWNGSTSGPAVDVGVELSYLDFGIGGVSVPVGTTTVDLPVKGAAGTPAVAEIGWRTPEAAGHYCLQARLHWPFDAEPGNNMGQHNVQVEPFNSPVAHFTVPVRNTARRPAQIRIAVDHYELPEPEPCPSDGGDRERAHRLERHRAAGHRHVEGWAVEIDGSDDDVVGLGAGETRDLTVRLVAPDGFVGRKAINVQGWDGDRLIGGVTLIGEGPT